MSSAVEAMSCSGKDIPTGKEEAARNAAASPAELGGDGTVSNGAALPHCRKEAEEDEVPNVIDLSLRVSIKDQLEKDKDDESLRRWKEELLGSVDLNSVGVISHPQETVVVSRISCLTVVVPHTYARSKFPLRIFWVLL